MPGDRQAALYELVHRGTPGDLAYYSGQVTGAARALELGCGYGRVLEALHRAHPTLELVGLDRDPRLLARARARLPSRVRLVRGDMRDPADVPSQDVILAPYSTLWCLPTEADALACFRAVRARLAPGGRFLFDAYAADVFHGQVEPEPEDEEPHVIAEIHEDDQGYRVFEQSTWRPEDQAFTVRYIHFPVEEGEVLETVIEHRYLLGEQLRALLERAGFARVELYAGFDASPWDPEADHLVGVAYADAGVEGAR